MKIVRTLVAALAIAILVPTYAGADAGVQRAPCGYQQITVLTAAVALTVPPACGSKASLAVITAEAQAVRYRDDGVDPTAAIGMPMATGVTLNYEGSISKIKFIEQTASAKLNVSFYR